MGRTLNIISKNVYVFNDKRVCANCEYFHQHYVYSKHGISTYMACDTGHCCYPRFKYRRPLSKACEHFKNIEWKEMFE